MQKDGYKKSMLDGSGVKDHFFEIQDTMKKYFANVEAINEKRKKYVYYKPATIEINK